MKAGGTEVSSLNSNVAYKIYDKIYLPWTF